MFIYVCIYFLFVEIIKNYFGGKSIRLAGDFKIKQMYSKKMDYGYVFFKYYCCC